MNDFELFHLPTSFDIDLEQLESQYLRLQKQYHPDRFAARTPSEQATAAQQCARINDAYQTLKAPLTRAQYLLEQAGVHLQSEAATFQDTAFLMLQMQWQEELEALKTTPAQLPDFAQKIQVQYETHLQSLAQTDAQQWENAKDALLASDLY